MDFFGGWNYLMIILMMKNKNWISLVKNFFKIIKLLIGVIVIGGVIEVVVV